MAKHCSRCNKRIQGYWRHERSGDDRGVLCPECYQELVTMPYGLGESLEDVQGWKWCGSRDRTGRNDEQDVSEHPGPDGALRVIVRTTERRWLT